MNPLSGTASSIHLRAIWTNAPVVPVRRIPGSDERLDAPAGDRWEPSDPGETMPQVTYTRAGTGGGGRCGST